MRRRLPVRFRRPSDRVSLSYRSDTPALAVAGRNRRRGRRSVTAVVICRVKSSSVAWASLAPSSPSGQATSDASYRPRRTPSRLTCSQAHPTELALCRESASAWPRSTPRPRRPAGEPLGATRAGRALICLRACAERVEDSVCAVDVASFEALTPQPSPDQTGGAVPG